MQNKGAARGFPPPTGSKRKVLGLTSSTKSGDGRLANRRPKDLGGSLVKSQERRGSWSTEAETRNCVGIGHWIFLIPASFGGANGGVAEK
ncbi:hypothetical protein U1Q18_007454 [Sarracenia purpurea var. burkii]